MFKHPGVVRLKRVTVKYRTGLPLFPAVLYTCRTRHVGSGESRNLEFEEIYKIINLFQFHSCSE